MVSFKTKNIQTQQTLGERLREARKSQYLTLERVSYSLKISRDYLDLLERGNYENLPGEVYAKNFIKLYSSLLGLDPNEMLSLYKREKVVQQNIFSHRHHPKWNRDEPTKIISRFHLLSLPKIFANFIACGIVVIFLIYIGIKVEAIIRPPELVVFFPAQDILIQEKFIEIKGKTLPEAHVVVNSQKILVSEEGEFTEKINLQEGINEITISSKKDHSKESVVYRRVVVEEK